MRVRSIYPELKSIFRIWTFTWKFDFNKFSGPRRFRGSGCTYYKCAADGVIVWRFVASPVHIGCPRMTRRLPGRTVMSLHSMKCVPAKMSTSRCSTIKPSNRKVVMIPYKCHSRVTSDCQRDDPSAQYELLCISAPNLFTAERRIIFPVAPLSIVIRAGWWW